MHAANRAPLREQRGFTMIELLIAMPLTLVVLGGLLLMLTTLSHWNSQTQEQTTLQTEARSALNTLEMELRGAFTGDGSAPIISATATSITFYSPDQYPATVAGATLSSFHLRKISYQVVNGNLQRQFMASTNNYPSAPPWAWPGAMSSWSTVVGSTNTIVNTDVFSFYTQAGAQATPPTPLAFPIVDASGVAAVGVKLTLSTGGSQGTKFTVTDTIAIRGTSD